MGNARIRFPNASMMQFFVNWRPVEDKLIKKAVMQAYKNQFAPREYPLTILFVTIDPKLVDVNVHPRKKEVKFLDTQHVFGKIYSAVQSSLSDKKISYDTQSHSQKQNNNSHTYVPSTKRFDMTHATRHIPRASEQTLWMFDAMTTSMWQNNNQTKNHIQSETPSETYRNIDNRLLTTSQWLQIVWQVRNMYILCQDIDHIYYVDQHALAERIAFEKLKKKLEHTNNYISKSLLTPLRIEVASSLMTQHKLNELAQYGFDCAMISDHSMVVYGIPTVFAEYVLDIESLVDKLALMEHLDMWDILDHIFATKACKSSIKAWQKLSSDEMKQLLEDGHTHIPWWFVCQHWRPFFVWIPKSTIDTLFDRH